MARGKKVEEKKEDVSEETEESEEKSSGTLSDGVLDAFEDEAPTGLEDETVEDLEDEEDALDDMDFRTSEDW